MHIKVYGDSDILLVDDDKDYHFIFRRFYQNKGKLENNLVSLYSGEECLDFLSELQNKEDEHPSLILMDINMPGMLGFECVQKIRETPAFAKDPVVIMLSSSNYSRDAKKAISSGANQYIEKPSNMNNMLFERVELRPASRV